MTCAPRNPQRSHHRGRGLLHDLGNSRGGGGMWDVFCDIVGGFERGGACEMNLTMGDRDE